MNRRDSAPATTRTGPHSAGRASTTPSPAHDPEHKAPLTFKRFVLQVVLNLPEPKPKPKPETTGAAPDPQTPIETNPWIEAAGIEAAAPEHAATARHTPAPDTVPWDIGNGRTAARAWRYTLRTFALVVLCLFAWLGIRATVLPHEALTAPPLPAAVTFDTPSAHAAAARIVTAALTWNEDNPQARAEVIALDYSGPDPTLGWNGKGRQEVHQVIPGTVQIDPDDDTKALVTVYAQVTNYTRVDRESPWEGGPTQWVSVEVPVTSIDGRMAVTASPAVTGDQPPPSPTKTPIEREDSPLTTQTKEIAVAFFEAYSHGDVEAVEVPGATIPAPQTSWELIEVDSWTVYAGSGDTRTARAQVTWAPDGDTQRITNTYELTLTRVVVADAERWQVSDIHVSR